jgi:hypothetical protein
MSDGAGWYRNRGAQAVTVMYPSSALLAPGERKWLGADPQFPDLVPCDAPDPAAADTSRSEP